MPAPPMMDLGSGMDTQKTIKQLMDIERIPIHRIEEDNERTKIEILAWEEVHKRVQRLERSTINLHSFAGPFNRRSIVSSDPGAISGEASSSADSVKQDMQILQLASKHQIKSDALKISDDLPPGKFTVHVNDKKIEYNFKGGKPSSLISLLKTKSRGAFDASSVRVDSENEMIVLRSHYEGEQGEIKIDDPDGLIQKTGLFKIDNEVKENETTFIFKKGLLVKNENTKKAVLQNSGKKLKLVGSVRYNIEIPENSFLEKKKNKKRTIEKPLQELQSEKGEETVKPVIMGPEIIVSVGDVRIKGHQIGRELFFRKKDQNQNQNPDQSVEPDDGLENKVGMGFIWKDGNKEIQRNVYFDPEDEDQHIEISNVTGGKSVQALYFFTGSGKGEYFNLKYTVKQPGSGKLKPAHPVELAKDALLRINGVEIKRPSNKNLTDIIKGASLNLHRVTGEPITVEAKANSEEIIKTLSDWINAYNDLLKFCRDNSDVSAAKDFKIDRPTEGGDIADGYREIKNRSGVFASDSTIRQLVITLQLITSQAYPSDIKPDFRVLADIGISTGDPGFQNWKNNKYGLLEVDESKLKNAIENSPLSVKELFSSDTNDDNVLDNGVGFMMTKKLKPYSRQSGGLIAIRIDLLKNKISDNKDRISRKELSLKKKEENLRQKFGRMESAIKKS
ncbi:MAG: flagellar filament capping protein FliD, partial [Spirochaetia bacterium]|nr:flagellar filament capping protein FliD [Spirochaetia bacterium]